ncbi:lytic murein transglycosylase B [Legionella adelaidensis]|uniref:lytic murein transglycosylase B n=1 Tax=Legionella adelaidensis TaxID=45056 RepID=UPI0010413B75|nr:lytic murein transglycosylase B [Legionella adelaidensis]
MRRGFLLFITFAFSLMSTQIFADSDLLRKKEVQYFIAYMVKNQGFNRSELVNVLRESQYQPQIIESMEKPYEKKSWDVYKNLFLTPQRVEAGVAYWQKNKEALEKAEKQFGVPAPIIVAIIGVETLYGQRQGEYRVLDALTTLAFYYPKRAPFFTKELKEYLLLCREQKVSPTYYMGSYAGAIGKPQFMPSSYRFYAVDFTGNGKRDLINEDRDVIGSVANFFHKHGWQSNQEVAQPAKVVGDSYKKLHTNTKMANYSFKRLVTAGVQPTTALTIPPGKAGIIELNTEKGEEYWVAYPNFYVITRYNNSPQYALVVYLLAQQLHNQLIAEQNSNQHKFG